MESQGLFLSKPWGGWLAIAEGGFFIRIEVFELSHHFTYGLSVILAINVVILIYLWRNRARLFA